MASAGWLGNRDQAVVHVKNFYGQTVWLLLPHSSSPISAARLIQRLPQLEMGCSQNMYCHLYSLISLERSLSLNHKNLRKFW